MSPTDRSSPAPWLIVNSAFNRRGGQELANLALARGLVERERQVTLVGHEVDPALTSTAVKAICLPRPLGSAFLGERLLERAAMRERARMPETTVFVGNSGNCPGANVSWVHFVHAAWPGELQDPPIQVRASHRLRKLDALRRERRAVTSARMVVANSERTKADLVGLLGVPERKIRSVYFGADGVDALPARSGNASRERTLLFVGALGWDRRKGLDIGLQALAQLSRRRGFAHRLVVAGAGTTAPWEILAARLGVTGRVSFVSFVDRIPELLSEADLLLSPSRYESYGLAIQESFCAGVPALVLADRSGFMERLGKDAEAFSVEGEDPSRWAERIESALANLTALRQRARLIGERILTRSWTAFAREFIEVAESGATGA